MEEFIADMEDHVDKILGDGGGIKRQDCDIAKKIKILKKREELCAQFVGTAGTAVTTNSLALTVIG